MSSAKNHAKRSHRSEHFKKASIGTSARKMWVKQAQQPKKLGLIARLKNFFRRKTTEG